MNARKGTETHGNARRGANGATGASQRGPGYGSEWREARLGDVVELKRGYDLPQAERRSGPIPIVSSSGITDQHSEAMVKGPGVVTGRYGTIGQVFFVREDFWPLNTTLYVRDFKGNDPRWVSYFLRTLDFLSYSDKAAVPGVNRNHLHQAHVRFPVDVGEQRGIAAILGALDDKIDLNRRMSEMLEAMARGLFKSWFVDFDPVRARAEGRNPECPTAIVDLFPSTFETTAEGPMPMSWRLGPFSDVVELHRVAEKPFESPARTFLHFSIPAYDDGQWPTTELGESIQSTKWRVPSGAILVSKLNPAIERVWLVDAAEGQRAVCSTEFLVLSPSAAFGRAYLYCLCRAPHFRQQLAALVTGTSNSHQRAPVDGILALEVAVPAQPVVVAFEEAAMPLLQRSVACRRESRTLAALRDTLLPKLISGELRIPDAERIVGEVA